MRDDRSLDEKLAPQDFVTDFVWAARAVFAQPSVALVSIAFCCLPTVAFRGPGPRLMRGLSGFALVVLSFGWAGAERLFFFRRREGRPLALAELLGSATPRFFARFSRLALLVGIVVVPFICVNDFVARHHAAQAGHASAARVRFAILAIATDLVLTFVTSALVFSTRSARRALRIGLEMIRQTWPRSALYVLCPPLALNMLNTIYPTQIRAVSVAMSTALALLALIAKGATAAFYLRERPVLPEVVDDRQAKAEP